jgi:hypothetical protein
MHWKDLRAPGESSSDFTDWMRGKNRLIAPTASAPWPKRKGDYQWPGLAISSVYPCFRRECRFSITAISNGPISDEHPMNRFPSFPKPNFSLQSSYLSKPIFKGKTGCNPYNCVIIVAGACSASLNLWTSSPTYKQ